MGLFNQHHQHRHAPAPVPGPGPSSLASLTQLGSQPSSQAMVSHSQTPAGSSSSSSSRSVHSTHSTATLRAGQQQTTQPLAYAVGRAADQHSHPHHHHQHQHASGSDVIMGDPSGMTMYVHHEHSSHSRPAPVPPARTTSLGHIEQSGMMNPSSADTLPSVHLTQATPTKRKSIKRDQHGRILHPQPVSPTLGHGSLDVTEVDVSQSEAGFTLPVALGMPFPVPGDVDSEEERVKQAESAKREKTRELGRNRQARKRARDKAKKAVEAGQSGGTPGKPTPLSLGSRNASSASLAPITVPLASAVTPPLGTSTSTSSSFYSSLPTSSSFPSISPGASPFSMPSQHVSGTSSPNTAFSPAMPGFGGGYEANTMWPSGRAYASKSAVDIRTPPAMQACRKGSSKTSGSSTNLSMAYDQALVAPQQQHSGFTTPSNSAGAAIAGAAIAGAAYMHSSKRRRSEPEPDLFKRVEVGVGLGVTGIAESGTMEVLDSPSENARQADNGNTLLSVKERPGIRRTASDSAAVALEAPAPMSSGSRSPTPPPIQHAQSQVRHTPFAANLTPAQTLEQESKHFSDVIARSLLESSVPEVNKMLRQLSLTGDDVLSMKGEWAAGYIRWKLEKDIKAVTLEEPHAASRPMSAYTSMATTPLQQSAPLSTTSTSSSSPSTSHMNLALAPALPLTSGPTLQPTGGTQTNATARSTLSQATPKGSANAPSRARSLSSASMRGRALKISGKTSTRSPIVARHPDPLVSPMSSTSFQFPNTPGHHHAMPGSDGASPLMSSVQTPNTGQSAYFNHDEIEAATAANYAYGGGGGGHHRSATDPVGTKVYSTRPVHAHPGSSYAAGIDQSQQDYYGHRPSASSSGLSSPVDMSMSMHSRHHSMGSSLSTQPPPHLYSGFSGAHDSTAQMMPSGASGGTQYALEPMMTPDHQRQHQQQQPHRGHHAHTSSLSSAFSSSASASASASNSPMTHMSRPSYPTGSVWQPNFTPIAEQGTPTRPSPNPSSTGQGMLGHDHQQQQRQWELDSVMLSPHPYPAPVGLPLEASWNAFQAPLQTQTYSGDPFTANPHPSI